MLTKLAAQVILEENIDRLMKIEENLFTEGNYPDSDSVKEAMDQLVSFRDNYFIHSDIRK